MDFLERTLRPFRSRLARMSRTSVSSSSGPSRIHTSLRFEWHQHAQRTGEDAISAGHKGPVLVYVAKAPSTAAAFDGQGTVWTKIADSGLVDPSSQTWATDLVNSNNGKHSAVIPASLPAGEYLLRAEIIALHTASSYPGAQFYIGIHSKGDSVVDWH
ncbi:hypothetical protein AAF712_002719 [Marasmius tenuissimus]|uniref:lytic cellulose monooxygenase (C4-dehydrogenating) n=1 Tax=Marasmius tenuissimus TaxID=585030 RepID=A0ABR3AA49_9AGAR